jgi:hypothetical protein
VQGTSTGYVQFPVVVTATFKFPKQMPFEPSVWIWVVPFEHTPDAHQHAPDISKNGIYGAPGIVRGRVPVPSNQDRQSGFETIQMIQ